MNQEEINHIQKIQEEIGMSKFKAGSKVQTMSFASYNVPQFKERLYKEWITCGPDNLWPLYLIHLSNNCGIHNMILDSKATQIAGQGLTIEDSQDKDQTALIEDFLKKSKFNKKQLKKIAIDQQMFGYWFLGITWNKARTGIARIYHVDASTIRVGIPDPDTRMVEHFFYSEDWTQSTKKAFAPEKICAYDPTNRVAENQLMIVTKYKPNTRYYGLPQYVGCIDSIESYYELSSHVLNNTKNGLSPSLNISFNNGEPSEEEREVIYRTINALYKGSKNAGKYILSFNKSKENATTIEPIQVSNMSEVYTTIKEKCQSDIIIGHGLPSPILAGVTIPGQLGGVSSEIERYSEIFYNKIIAPNQQEIADVIQEILEVNGWTLKVWIKESQSITYKYDDTTLMNICTVDELRKKIGLPPLSESDRTNLAVNITQPAAAKPAVPGVTPEGMSDEAGIVTPAVNDSLRGLTPQENSDMYRIVRDYTKGKLNEHLALARIQAYGIDEETSKKILGIAEEEQLSIDSTNVKPYVKEVEKKK